MLDPATDVDLVASASVSVANFSGCQYFSCQCLWLPVPQLPVFLAASISCQFLWLPVPKLPVSRLPGTSVASVSGCQYLSCQCFWLPVSVASFSGCQYLSCQCLGCREVQLPVSLPQLLVPLPQLLVPLHQLPVSRLLVPKLPVPLPRLLVSAGALAGVHVLCHGC